MKKKTFCVYRAEPANPYAGGLILIAASNNAEATKILKEYDEDNNLNKYSPVTLMSNLSYSGEKACIIIDRTYYE